MRTSLAIVLLLLTGFSLVPGSALAAEAPKDPALAIPLCKTAPKIDGTLSPDEWKYAAAISMLEAYPCGVPKAMRQEQVLFYVCWDKANLYVAMDSLESNSNTIVAACSMHDNMRIIGDDCAEVMVAPGAGEDVKRFDFPTFYFALNSIGTLWDAKFYPQLAETHNSWQSDAEIAHAVDGTRWTAELRIPLGSIRRTPPKDGEVWRMNFDRTYFGYNWSAWNARGGLNDARIGGDVTFATQAPAVRLLPCDALVDANLSVKLEIANPTDKPQTVALKLTCTGQDERGKDWVTVGTDRKEATVAPGKVEEVVLGRGQRLRRYNQLALEVSDGAGRRLFFLERAVHVPSPRMVKRVAPAIPLVYVFPRFLPSIERLAVLVDYTAWAKKTGYVGKPPRAHIQVFPKGEKAGKPVLAGTLEQFRDNRGTWRHSTQALAEGDYVVKVKVTAGKGEVIAEHDDWFVKRIFDWMRKPRGVGERVPTPYTPLKVDGNAVSPWGRRYAFAPTGLPARITSQGKELLKGEATLHAQLGGKAVAVQARSPVRFTSVKPGEVRARSALAAGDLRLDLESTTEYDGFTLFRLTYGPAKDTVTVGRLRLRIPLDARHARFYSAAGDTQGTCIQAAVLPDRQGRILDSLNDTHSVTVSTTFATLFWVGDYDTCFCFAADNDKGWLLRDDAPALEVVREGDVLTLWLNFVDRKAKLTAPRTLEFALQAGPLKPLPDGWRGLQDGGNPDDAPLTIKQLGGSGYTLAGGTHIIHPGNTPEQHRRSRENIDRALEGGQRAVVGYHFWGMVPKGLPETRVFRGEWGIDRQTWETTKSVRQWEWKNRFYGDNQDLYVMMRVNLVPSYVDFLTYAYDEALKHSRLSGFYDDTGYPKPVYDEELGLGFVRDDGRRVYSSGLWTYRERWKRAAYVNFAHGRPNYLRDSQHCHAHFMPAYGFIGIWAPCERGYYNPFNDRDQLGFYGSAERYAAYNPAAAFGQIPMIGMSSRQSAAPAFAADSRCIMMLAMLHDHDVGSFGHRDARTVAKLRHARNLFRTWEPDVRFTGYWRSASLVQCNTPGVRVSLFHRPGAALLVVGNVGDKPAQATLRPQWKALELDPKQLEASNAETGERLAVTAGGLTVSVPRHDLRLVLLGPPGTFPATPQRLGKDLPRPREVLAPLSERFDGDKLPEGWHSDLHEGQAAVWMLDGRLCVQGAHYGYAHIRRKLGVDNISAQCLILRTPTGCSDTSGGSLFLYWPNGQYVQATPGTGRGKFTYVVSGGGRRQGSDTSKRSAPGWYPFRFNWVKIALTPDAITFYASADGKQWVKDWQAKRTAKLDGPPECLILGNGHAGKNLYLNNVVSQHFHGNRTSLTFFSDLVVGKSD
jgi:hypothetical protein